jgi:hypothetical protein
MSDRRIDLKSLFESFWIMELSRNPKIDKKIEFNLKRHEIFRDVFF